MVRVNAQKKDEKKGLINEIIHTLIFGGEIKGPV